MNIQHRTRNIEHRIKEADEVGGSFIVPAQGWPEQMIRPSLTFQVSFEVLTFTQPVRFFPLNRSLKASGAQHSAPIADAVNNTEIVNTQMVLLVFILSLLKIWVVSL